MDIADAVTSDFVDHDVKTPASKLSGAFERQDLDAVVVTNGGAFDGLVTRSELLSSQRPPDETAMSLARDPPTVQRTEDVREVARLLVENQLHLLPVFEGEEWVGVVTAEGLLEMVGENLGVLDVSDVYTRDPISVTPETGLGEVIHVIREHGFTHVPVVDDDGAPTGVVSVHDLVAFTVRQVDREQGGAPDGFDGHGGEGSDGGYRTHGGYGERSGFEARLLDLPARDVMSSGVQTATDDDSLDEAVGRMLEADISSLVVVEDDDSARRVTGIVTLTDALRALTWTGEQAGPPVQIFNVDLMDDLTREAVAERIEGIVAEHEHLQLQEATVIFHEHEETLRGVPLVLATVRLFTDRGRFSGSHEGYGAGQAFRGAADVVEQNVLQEKGRELDTHARKGTDQKQRHLESLVGWRLEEF
jgi:CBS domain-containing protein